MGNSERYPRKETSRLETVSRCDGNEKDEGAERKVARFFFLSRRDSDDERFLSLPINKHQLEHETVQRSMIKFKLFVTIPIREGIVKNGTKCLSHAYLF